MQTSRSGNISAHATLLVVCSVLLSGCLSAVKAPALPPPIRLVAPDGFTLYARTDDSGVLEAHCGVKRLDGEVLSVRGDSILLGSVRVEEQPRGARACVKVDSLYVLASRDTLVKAEVTRADDRRTFWVTAFLVPVVGFVSVVLLLATYGGS